MFTTGEISGKKTRFNCKIQEVSWDIHLAMLMRVDRTPRSPPRELGGSPPRLLGLIAHPASEPIGLPCIDLGEAAPEAWSIMVHHGAVQHVTWIGAVSGDGSEDL